MGQLVVMGAMMACSFGAAPVSLVVEPSAMVNAGSLPAATIQDAIPTTNIPTFGMCTTQSNPAVAAATSAASGTPTPAPCVPVTVSWAPGSPTVMIGGQPALNNSSKCMCTWGGQISISNAGQATVNVP